MNTATSGVARAAGIVLVLVLAAAAGLAVGKLIQQVNGDGSNPASPRRSLEGLAALQAIRDEESTGQTYADYGVRHAPVFQDYGIRHLADTAATPSPTSDTFRLTGPSDVDEPVVFRRRAN